MRRTPRRRNKKEDPTQLIKAIVISAGVLMVWQTLFPPPPPVAPKAPTVQQSPERSNSSHLSTPSKESQVFSLSDLTPEQIAQRAKGAHFSQGVISPSTLLPPPEDAHTLTRAGIQEIILNTQGQISTWSILEEQYRQKAKKGTNEKRVPYLLSSLDFKKKSPFISPKVDVYVNEQLVEGIYTKTNANDREVSFSLTSNGVHIERTYEMTSDHYNLTAKIRVRNLGHQKSEIKLIGVNRGLQDVAASGGSMFSPPLNLLESLCVYGDDLERDSRDSIVSKLEEKEPTSFEAARWFAVDSRYFMSAMSSKHLIKCRQGIQKSDAGFISPLPERHFPISTQGVFHSAWIDPQSAVMEEINFYIGPKKLEALAANKPPLSEAIDFGIFSPLCVPMLVAMRMFFDVIPNWGIAIILLTLLVKLATSPLTVKQYKSMAAMKKLQPEMTKLKEQYQKTDPMRFQQETMGLYKKHGVNPLAGCLPMLVMMPVYFALYRTIFSAVELYQAPFFGWLADLSMPDPYFITPVLLAGMMFIQTNLQPNPNMDPTQRKMMTIFMPIFFGAMMLFLPSGLVIYILVNTILGILQQRWIQNKSESEVAQ